MPTSIARGVAIAAAVSAAVAWGGPSPPVSWSPFSDRSPWNQRIENAPLQSEGMLRGFATHHSSTYIRFLNERAAYTTISTSRWSIPVYFVDGSTQRVTVEFTGEAGYEDITAFLAAMNPVPIPQEAVSDPGETGSYPPGMGDIVPDRNRTDAHMCLIDLSDGSEYDFWHMARDSSGVWRASAGAKVSIYGDGVAMEADLRTYSFARGTAVPLAAGLIWRHEIAAGEIRHALAMSIPPSRNQRDFYVWPGLLTDGGSADSRSLPEGARLRLKWSEQEIERRYEEGQISAAGRVIALALRRYGAISVDNGGEGHLAVYAQNFSDAWGDHNQDPQNWGGLLHMDEEGYADDIAIIRPSDFEVIQFEYGREGIRPSVSANGAHGSTYLHRGDLLAISVSLEPGGYGGSGADWWAAASTPFGLYWFVRGLGWVGSDSPVPAHEGPLFSLPSYEILRTASLPEGAYMCYFGVDLVRDGSPNRDSIHYDGVAVTIGSPLRSDD